MSIIQSVFLDSFRLYPWKIVRRVSESSRSKILMIYLCIIINNHYIGYNIFEFFIFSSFILLFNDGVFKLLRYGKIVTVNFLSALSISFYKSFVSFLYFLICSEGILRGSATDLVLDFDCPRIFEWYYLFLTNFVETLCFYIVNDGTLFVSLILYDFVKFVVSWTTWSITCLYTWRSGTPLYNFSFLP